MEKSRSDDDRLYNCVSGACCPALADRVNALARWMRDEGYADEMTANRCAQAILTKFDLAPVGSLSPLVQTIVRIYRAPSPKADA